MNRLMNRKNPDLSHRKLVVLVNEWENRSNLAIGRTLHAMGRSKLAPWRQNAITYIFRTDNYENIWQIQMTFAALQGSIWNCTINLEAKSNNTIQSGILLFKLNKKWTTNWNFRNITFERQAWSVPCSHMTATLEENTNSILCAATRDSVVCSYG